MSFSIVFKIFIIFSLILFLGYGETHGQYKVIGAIIDDKNLPVPYARVFVSKSSDSLISTSAVTSVDGKFSLFIATKGKYVISVNSKLYKHFEMPFSVQELNTILPNISLHSATVNLQEVNIRVKKQVYEQKIDRLVVNIGGQGTLLSGSVLEILEKLPGVRVDRQTSSISLNGKDEVGIMLEGKILNVPLSSLVQLLSTMEAGNIKQVELITNPPAKYDAGNAGGLINIIMNKRISDGSSGSYTIGFGYGDFDKEKLAVNWNKRKGKLNFFGDISYNRDHSYRKFGNYKTVDAIDNSFSTETISSRFPISKNYSGRLGFDYDLSSKVILGGTIYGLVNTWDQEVNSEGNILIQADSVSALAIVNSENSSKVLITNDLNLSYKVSKNSNLDFDLDYLHFYNKNPNLYSTKYFDSNMLIRNDVLSSEKKTPVNIWAGRVDYGLTINKLKLEIGYKMTLTSLDNLVKFNGSSGANNHINLNSFSDSHLMEKIHALYISSKWEINRTTNLNTGLRYERSDTELSLSEQDQNVNRNLGKLFPTIYLSKSIGSNSILQLSYGKRINRPTYNDLAPFILFLDPTTVYNGNISLLPSISNIYTLGYSYRKYSLSSEFTDIYNPIFRYQPVLSENNTQVFMPINLKRNKIYSLILSFPIKLSSWWQIDNSFQGIAQSITLSNGSILSNSYFRIRATQNVTLPKQYSLQVFASYQSERLTGISRTSPSNKIDIAIDKKWLTTNDHLQLSISNLLPDRYNVTSIKEENPNFYARTDYRYESRVIRLTYTHLFGKAKAQRKINKAIDDIEERVIK